LLRHCTGSIPKSDTGYCHSLNASCPTNRNEYREYFLGYQGIHGPIVLKSGSLNLLQPAQPVQGLLDLYLYISGLKKSNKVQQYTDIYLLLNYYTCSRRPLRRSSAVHKAVVVASGTDRTVWGTSFFQSDQISPYLVKFVYMKYRDFFVHILSVLLKERPIWV